MNENEEMMEQEAQEEPQELTDEQVEAQLYAEAEEEAEEVSVLEEDGEEAGAETDEDDAEGEQEQQEEEEPAHRARDEPGADEQFARRVREAYGGMTDEQIVEAMLTAQAERMHAEDPEISVKAAKMILEARAKSGGAEKAATQRTAEADAHTARLTEQAREMAGTKEGAALLREMLSDEKVKAKIDAGEWDVKQARAYYEGKRESAAQARRAPTTMKTKSAQTVRRKSIDEMSDAEFAQIEAKVDDALRRGKRIKF